MGLLNNTDWNDAVRKALEKGSKRVAIVEVRDVAGKPNEDGSPPRDVTFITLRLEEDGKTTDGDVMKAGGTFEVALNTRANPDNDEKTAKMNQISMERFRELVVAGLGLDPKEKDVAGALEKAGGADALKGRSIVVDVAPSKMGGNNVNKFAAVPKPA